MSLTDPNDLLESIDLKRWNKLRGARSFPQDIHSRNMLEYVEPSGYTRVSPDVNQASNSDNLQELQPQQDPRGSNLQEMLTGKVQNLGDFVDTDAVRLKKYLQERNRLANKFGAACPRRFPYRNAN
jgi:hypothetical protein